MIRDNKKQSVPVVETKKIIPDAEVTGGPILKKILHGGNVERCSVLIAEICASAKKDGFAFKQYIQVNSGEGIVILDK